MLEHKTIDIDLLIPYSRNARIHTEAHVAQLAGSIREFGFNVPVLIDEKNNIIAGHGRVLAARKLGITEVPVLIADHLSDTQRKAFIIADNKLHDNSAFDYDALNLEMEELKLEGFDMKLMGFEEFELRDDEFGGFGDSAGEPSTPYEGKTDEEYTPPTPEEPTSKLGQIWTLGNHRLMCGDSTNIKDVETLMDGTKADMVFTDPPYGIDIGNQSQGKGGGLATHIDYGVNEWDKEIPHDAISLALTLSDCCVLWGANYYTDRLPPSSCWIVWDKDNSSNDFADVELAWTSYKKASRLIKWKWHGMLQEDMSNKEKRVHPTQKPTALAEWTFGKFDAGNVILDLFGGSGSTLIACEKTGRKCMMMELDPKYCDVIIKRYEEFSGNKAVLITSN